MEVIFLAIMKHWETYDELPVNSQGHFSIQSLIDEGVIDPAIHLRCPGRPAQGLNNFQSDYVVNPHFHKDDLLKLDVVVLICKPGGHDEFGSSIHILFADNHAENDSGPENLRDEWIKAVIEGRSAIRFSDWAKQPSESR